MELEVTCCRSLAGLGFGAADLRLRAEDLRFEV